MGIFSVVIDGGSSDNVKSQALMDGLKLRVCKKYHAYFVCCLMTSDEVQIRYTCELTFAISEDYTDIVWYNVILMDSGDILRERPWMYDKL